MKKEVVYVNCHKCGRVLRMEIPENTCGGPVFCSSCGHTSFVTCNWNAGQVYNLRVLS